jgi:hypothetical protein
MGAEAGLQVADRIRVPAARILGTRCTALCHARIIRPSTGHAAGTNGRDNTPLDARRCCSRGIIDERVRVPADQAIWRRGPGHSRARRRLRLRLGHRSCSTTGSFEARLHETPGHHFETRAVPRTLGSARRPASLLRVCADSLSTRNQDAQADCTLCRLPARSFASLSVDAATCRLLARPAVRPAPILITERFDDAPNEGVADDSQHPVALRAPASTFGPGLPCKSCSKRRLMR